MPFGGNIMLAVAMPFATSSAKFASHCDCNAMVVKASDSIMCAKTLCFLLYLPQNRRLNVCIRKSGGLKHCSSQ